MTDDKTAEERIAALEAEIAALRKHTPKEQPLYKTYDGQGQTLFDRSGNRVLPPAVPSQTTVGGNGGFGSVYRADGTYAPDGVPRNKQTGEVLSAGASTGSIGEGPHRTASHQLAIDHLDRAFPLHRTPPTKE